MRPTAPRTAIFGRSFLTLALVVSAFAVVMGSRLDIMLAQTDDLEISYPADGAEITGPDVVVIWSVPPGLGGRVVAIVDGDGPAVPGEPIPRGPGVILNPTSPLVLTDLEPGDHTIQIVATGAELSPLPDAEPVLTRFTVLPPLPVSINQGICAGLSAQPTFPLSDAGGIASDPSLGAVSEADTAELPFPATSGLTSFLTGTEGAVLAIVSETTIDAPLSQVLGRAHAVAIRAAGDDTLADGDLAACGEIGGIVSDGVLRVGLPKRPGSDIYGVATFVDLESQTYVLVQAVRSGEPRPTEDQPGMSSDIPERLEVSLQDNTCAVGGELTTSLNPATRLGANTVALTVNEDDPASDGEEVTQPNTPSGQGVPFAVPVLVSQTELEGSAEDLLIGEVAIVVEAVILADEDETESEATTVVVCGDIGGPLISGVLRVALADQGETGFNGVATIFDLDGRSELLIEVFRVPGAAISAPTPSPSPTPTETVEPAVETPTLEPTSPGIDPIPTQPPPPIPTQPPPPPTQPPPPPTQPPPPPTPTQPPPPPTPTDPPPPPTPTPPADTPAPTEPVETPEPTVDPEGGDGKGDAGSGEGGESSPDQ